MQYQELASVFFLCCLPGCFLKAPLHKAAFYSRNRGGAAYSLEEKPLSHSVPAYFEKYPDICIRQLIGTKNHFFPHYFIHKIKEQRVMQKSRSQHK